MRHSLLQSGGESAIIGEATAILILNAGLKIRPVIPAGKPESSVHGWQTSLYGEHKL